MKPTSLLGAALLIAVGFAFWRVPAPAVAASAPPPRPALAVRTSIVETRSLIALDWLPAQVVGLVDATLSFEVAGELNWLVEVGQNVQRGEPIARVAPGALSLTLAQAQAQEKRIDAQMSLAQLRLKRFEASSQALSLQQMDEARAAVAVLSAEAAEAAARRNEAERMLSATTLRAPFHGIVSERLASRGERLVGGSPVLRLVSAGTPELELRAPLEVAQRVKVGQNLSIRSAASAGSARLSAVVPVGAGSVRQSSLRLKPAANMGLLIGTTVEVGIPQGQLTGATLAVPSDAVVMRASERFVYRVDANQHAQKVLVETGAAVSGWVPVLGGLKAGDKVVVRGAEGLSEGTSVSVLKDAG